MGIKDLNPFLKGISPDLINEQLLSKFSGKKVAVDTSIYLYKFLYKNDRFIESFFKQINRLKANNITPIYIFDGKPPIEKMEEIKSRQDKKMYYMEKIAELNNQITQFNENPPVKVTEIEDVKDNNDLDDVNVKLDKIQLQEQLEKFQKKLIIVTKEHIRSLKYFFDLLNIKYIQADCEADIICSKLCENGIVDMVLSDDMDLLASGSRIVLRNFNMNSNKISVYDIDRILQTLDINYNQWIDFCILCGCDYLKRVRGLGPKNAYTYIKTYGTIEKIIENMFGEGKKYTLPDNYDYEKARKLFKECDYYKPEYNSIDVSIELLFDNQLSEIKKYLMKHTKLSDRTIQNRVKNIYNL
jgi:flap endonuclease-1